MKKLFTILLCLSALYCTGQKKLTNSRTGSYYTYIYKISDKDLLGLYKMPDSIPSEKMLGHAIDSVKTGENFNADKLPAGNYFKVYTAKNKLEFSLIEKHTAFLHLLSNSKNIEFILTDRKGNTITGAAVTSNNKPVSFNVPTGIYSIKAAKKNIIQVNYNGVANFYDLKKGSNRYGSQSWFRKQWWAFKRLFKKQRESDYTRRYRIENERNGFMVFNKPKYKPNDTVKFKAFIVNPKSKKPIKLPSLQVKLYEEDDSYEEDEGKILGEVKSYTAGGYEYSFVLSDSLDLDLDDTYKISLEDPKRFSADEKDDDADEVEEESMSKVYMAGKFVFEEYELKSTSFTMRTDKSKHERGNPLNLFFKATDENDLPVPDGRVEIVVRTSNATLFYSKKEFVPDTLWRHTLKLEPVGETKLTLPDSIFPKADISYYINADFYNSANEHRNQYRSIGYDYTSHKLNAVLVKDTLKFTGYLLGKPANFKTKVYAILSSGDTLFSKVYTLPAAIKINPDVTWYQAETDSASVTFTVKNEDSGVNIDGYRTNDSVSVKVNNSRRLHFWYTIYAGDKLISKGETDSLFYKSKTNIQGHITCLVHYIWGGQLKTEKQVLPHTDKQLTINVKQPLTVYPGQKVKTEIEVKNGNGNPVPGTDITAWAITSKFEDYRTPYVPYIGKLYPVLQIPNRVHNVQLRNTWNTRLNWKRWSRSIGLDSIEYYRFTHPDTIYRIEEALPANDTTTQIAPFVVKDGDIIPVHILYIDGIPVYFSQAEQLPRYSFKVNPGKHSIRFRTQNRDIFIVNDVLVPRNKKLILSINAELKNKAANFNNLPDTLTTYEADLINKYMIKVANTFKNKLATLEHSDRMFVLNPEISGIKNDGGILAGPLAENVATYSLKNETPQTFLTEPGYTYTFLPGLIKQKSYPTKYPFNKALWTGTGTEDYTQYVINRPALDTIWQNYLDLRSHTTQLFVNNNEVKGPYGELIIRANPGDEPYFIKNIIIYRNDDPDFIEVHPGNKTYFQSLAAGKYRLFFLLKKDRYAVVENIIVKTNGKNFYEVKLIPKPKDSVSIKISGVIAGRNGMRTFGDTEIKNDALLLKEAFNAKYLDDSNFKDEITGVVSDIGGVLPGASVHVKGAPGLAAATDINGRFRLRVPPSAKIIVGFIGYTTQEISVRAGGMYTIVLQANMQALEEVVVIGYGTTRRQSITGAVSTVSASTQMSLSGRLPGLSLQAGAPGSNYEIQIRGVSSVDGSGKKPLIVVDGMVVTEEELKAMGADEIEEITILKDTAATGLYGSLAANGVLLVTTKKKIEAGKADAAQSAAQEGQQTLRKNFNDYAYWQPKLTTDAEGKVSFTTVYPDDITSWRTFVIGITGNRETGFLEKEVKSFKPLSAAFISPQFAVQGDKLSAIGKVMNYNAEPAKVSRSFMYNGKVLKQDSLLVINSKIDTLNITAADTDSLTFEYSLKRANGYFDGEQRKIPVIQQGVQETKGVFEALRGDTTVNFKFDNELGLVTLRAEASALPALIEETQKLREYRYLCNEQLASKLKGLLVEKRIKTYLNQTFAHNKNVKEIIEKLLENRGKQGIWGWWKNSSDELWISLHAIEALVEAEKQGYKVNIDKQKITDYLVYQLESYHGRDKIACLELLYKIGAKVDYKKYAEELYNERLVAKPFSQYNKLRILLLLQQAGVKIDADELLNDKKQTMFGNIYWGENSYSFFDNSNQLSILAYRLFKNEGKHQQVLEKITGYLLEQRRDGGWRNTYESSLILETILPDLLVDGKQIKAPALKLSGAKTEMVEKFPYSTTFTGNGVTVSKTGTLPVYITGYQQFWNRRPEKVSKDFTVDTWFEKGNAEHKLIKLKGGEKVELKAKVTARADGEFVMVEIPIPAGCSYESKEQAWDNNEVHREYFKEKVSIFCRALKQGTYTFTINLMPRYDGEYTLNPAKAELMYFPVFYGREGMRKITIGN